MLRRRSWLIRARSLSVDHGLMVTPLLATTATALFPPSMNRLKLSCRPDGDLPLIWSWIGFDRANAFFGVRATVSFAAL